MYTISDVINKETKDYKAVFSFYRSGKMYYNVVDNTGKAIWEFPVDVTNTDDIGNAVFPREIKAITLMRYIRKAIDSESLISLVF
jgi:hypothetical protein